MLTTVMMVLFDNCDITHKEEDDNGYDNSIPVNPRKDNEGNRYGGNGQYDCDHDVSDW